MELNKLEDRIGRKDPRGCDAGSSLGAGQTMPDVAINAPQINDSAMRRLLTDAKNEIQGLRSRNEILSAQMGIVDVFAAALGLKRDSGGMCPDVAWELQRKIDEMSTAQASLY